MGCRGGLHFAKLNTKALQLEPRTPRSSLYSPKENFLAEEEERKIGQKQVKLPKKG